MATVYVWNKYTVTTSKGLISSNAYYTSTVEGGTICYLYKSGLEFSANSNGYITVSGSGMSSGISGGFAYDAKQYPYLTVDDSESTISSLYQYMGTSTLYWSRERVTSSGETKYKVGLSSEKYGTTGSVSFIRWRVGNVSNRGDLIDTVTSMNSISDYPSNGVHSDGYWYVYSHSYEPGPEAYVNNGSIKQIQAYTGYNGTVRKCDIYICKDGVISKV